MVLPISVFATGVMVVFASGSDNYGDKTGRRYIIQIGEICSELRKKLSSAANGNVGEMTRLKMTAFGQLVSSSSRVRWRALKKLQLLQVLPLHERREH